MEFNFRFVVDVAHCQRATDELHAMLRQQQRGLVERICATRLYRVLPNILSWFGVALSVLGLAVCLLAVIFDTRQWWSRPELVFVPVFIGFIVVFYLLPRSRNRIYAWSLRRADHRGRRSAERLTRMAKGLAPFEAAFDLKGDLLTYARGKEGEWQFAWHRKLSKFRDRGFAVQAVNVTAIFRRPTSLIPAIVILHENPNAIGDVLREVGVPISGAEVGTS